MLAALALASALSASAQMRCSSLIGAVVPGGRVVSARVETLAEGPAICRIQARLSSGPGSSIGLEVWAPVEGWTGRVVQLGTGGFSGTFPEAGIAAEVRRGATAVVTDFGHVGRDGFDASWAVGAPARIADYGYRALGLSARAGQAITTAFHGTPARTRYFVGCSNGGRQALMAAERYGDLFDGVLAGAPAWQWTGQMISFALLQWQRDRLGVELSPSKLALIADRARQGAFDPRALLCAPGASQGCLTAAEVEVVATAISGAHDPKTGERLAFGFEPTVADAPGGWDAWIFNPNRSAQTQRTLAEGFFGAMVHGRTDWRLAEFEPADIARAKALSPVLDVPGPRLKAFRRHGGKLILYSGWADPVIAPASAVDYFQRLPADTQARLFMIPAMLHCQGGQAPAAFGQAPIAPAAKADADHDVRLALEAWVEQGRAPERLVAAHYVGDDPAKGVASLSEITATPRR